MPTVTGLHFVNQTVTIKNIADAVLHKEDKVKA
jgi:hypothetical protein